MNHNNELHVVFGTGPLGRSVINALTSQKKRVRAVNRSGAMPHAPAGVEVVSANVNEVQSAIKAAEGAVSIYQCAQPEYHEWVDKYIPLQNKVLEAAMATGAKFIVGDNLYMYGDTNGQPLHEGLPYAAHTRKGKVRAQAAQIVQDAHAKGRVRAAIGRASDFYGPYVLGSAVGEMVFAPMLAGKKPSVTGNLDALHTYTFIEDFGHALAILGTDDRALGEVWHVPNAPTVTTREFLRITFHKLDQQERYTVMGRLMMRIGGMFIPVAREMIEMMYEFEKPFIVDDSKFKRTFGDISTPLYDGIRRTLAWYKAHAAETAKA